MNHYTPLVTIAIPVYNGSNYLRESIESVLAQTYTNCEVLVINDGSTDGGKTEQISRSFEDKVRYYYKDNGGVASALNFALREANGVYFCWLSHDDIYLPQKIEREIEVFRSLPDKNVVVYSSHSYMDSRGNHLHNAPAPAPFTPTQTAYSLMLRQWLHCCTILALKELFLEFGGFREDLPTTQDYDLLVKMGLKYPFIGLSEVLLKSRAHPEQGSHTLAHQEEVEAFFQGHIPLLSPEYMHANFSSRECIRAFNELAEVMCERHYANAILVCGRQLVLCEKERADADALWTALLHLTVDLYPAVASLTQKKGWNTRLKFWIRPYIPKRIWVQLYRIKSGVIHVGGKKKEDQKLESLDFKEIYMTNAFNGRESRSGEGSSLFQTRKIREEIPKLLRDLDIHHLLDVPCGDWNWMQYVDLGDIQYTGGDVVKEIVDRNIVAFRNDKRVFKQLNIVTGPIPHADLILCRDCLVHLNFSDGLSAIEQFRKSGAKWFLSTTFTNLDSNCELYEGQGWRPINLENPPYNLGKAELIITEGCTENNGQYSDKALSLWRINV
jgi:glycosyltransferase involved in cell wall biosynthesis